METKTITLVSSMGLAECPICLATTGKMVEAINPDPNSCFASVMVCQKHVLPDWWLGVDLRLYTESHTVAFRRAFCSAPKRPTKPLRKRKFKWSVWLAIGFIVGMAYEATRGRR